MRILLSTIGSRGDVQPLVALASALKARGHEARFCVPPDFQDWIETLGFAVTPIGPKVRQATSQRPAGPPAPFSPEQRRLLAEGTVLAQRDAISAAARGCDLIVAATALQIVARSVAEHFRIPYVFVAYSPVVLPSPHHAPPPLPPLPDEPPANSTDNRELWSRDAARFNALFRDALNACRAAMQLPPVDDVRGHVFGDEPWLAADRTLGPWPEDDGARVFQAGAWVLDDRRPLTSDIDAFLEAGDPPLYFGFGSTRVPQDVASAAIGAARALGKRAILSRGWADVSALDGTDCLTIGEANLAQLFTRVAAVVHHGGAGTTTLAALAGAPQVVVPQIYDQHYWARRVAELGIGTAHPPEPPTAETFAMALTSALRPDAVARARAVSSRVQHDGAHAAAERLVEVAALGGRG